MASVRVMYWHHIPTQVKASDEDGAVSRPLPDRFMAAVDQAAMKAGLAGSDDYLAGWNWGEAETRPVSAVEAATAVVGEIVAAYEGKPIPLKIDS